ncbi:MAG TPA: MFS transporter [Roseiflexaceae bacterium]|nr:MFS transporter [Roseiflexaceae bacterium]
MRVASWKQGAFSVLDSVDYRRLLAGTVVWWQCFYMEMVVLGWLVFDLSNSARTVSLVGFCRTLPLLLVSLFSGPIIDYVGRRRVVIAAQSANLSAYLAIVLLLWSGRAAPWNIAIVAFCLGSAWAIDWPTRRSLVPDILGKDRMFDGLLLESFLTGLTRIIAPSMAGALIARYGAVGCYIGMAILSVSALAILVPLLRGSGLRGAKAQRMAALPVAGEGMRYVRSNQTILAVVLITLIMNLWIFPYNSLLPIFAREVLRKGPIELGFLSTGTGLGSFLGLLVLNFLRRRVNVGTLFVVGTAWMCVALAVFALSHLYPLSWAMLLCAGMGMACFGTLQSTIVLLATSDEMRSRVMGILVLAIGGDPLGQLQIGTLAERFGVQATLAGQASAALLALGLIVMFLPGVLRPQAA